MGRSRGNRRRPAPAAAAGLGLGATLLLAGLVLSSGCGSLPKTRLEKELLSLPGNAPIRTRGLSRVPLTIDIDGEARELVLTYLLVPRTEPAPAVTERPVVLVHGTPSTLFTWNEVALGGAGFAGLAVERDVYALEIIGHGVAEGSAAPYGFQRCADFVVAALRALGLEDVHLVGSSYGGEFVWRAALDAPELVRSLTLVDASGFPRRDEDWLPEEVAMRENPLARFGWRLNSREAVAGALEPHFAELPGEHAEEVFLVCENAENWRAMVALARDENGTRAGELSRLAVPTLLLWGERDLAYPVDVYGVRFAREIPRAELRVLPTGHYPHEERPADVVRELERFFAEQES